MKQVEITSKVVGRGESEGITSAIPSINLSGFALKSDLLTLEKKFSDFLNVPIIDGTINRWNELETFLAGISEDYNLLSLLNGKADKSYVDTNFVTIAGTEDVTGLHNFVNGLKIGGLPITKTQDDVVYLDANLVVRGGITMYGDGEGGSSVPLYSTLGSLENVDKDAIDAVASVDRVLFQSAGSNVWSWKALSEIGGGSSGGSISGDYLPLSGGTLTGYLNVHYNHGVGISSLTAINSSELAWNRADNISLRLRSSNNAMAISVSGTQNNRVGFIQVGHQDYKYASNLGDLYLNKLGGNVYIGENLAIHAGNYSSYALPLSGGTLTASVAPQLKIVNNGNTDAYITMTGSNGYSAHAGMVKLPTTGDAASFGYSERIVFPVTGGMYYRNGYNGDNQVILHAGNIGSYNAGSANYLRTQYSNSSSWYDDFLFYCKWATDNGNILDLKCDNYYTRVDFAKQLNTARTIWGQSFDGTGNVAGNISMGRNSIVFSSGRLGSHNSKVEANTTNIITWEGKDDSYLGYVGYYADHFIFCNYKGGTENSGFSVYDNGNISTIGDGNFGIRTASPSFPLHVVGTTYLQGYLSVNNYATFEWQSTGANPEYASRIGSFDHKGGFVIQFGKQANSTTKRFEIIDQNWTTALFYVDYNGNVLANGGITMYSDQRKKTILNHVELSLKQIADAPLIEHYYNSDQDKTTHVGSIAQYWADINDWFCKLDNEGYYTMEIQNCALASAISIARHLEKYETKTDKTIRKMKKRIQELEDEVERLKKGA